MTDKPNTRPWGEPEDDNELDDEAVLALLYGKYPRMQEDMVFYASIMERGAAFSVAIVTALHCLCLGFIQLHIRTPRGVKRTIYYASRFLIGFTAAATVMWLLAALFVR
jgi:hypothetical protein